MGCEVPLRILREPYLEFPWEVPVPCSEIDVGGDVGGFPGLRIGLGGVYAFHVECVADMSADFLMCDVTVCDHPHSEKIVETFVDGADDMIGVILVIAVARGASVLMKVTYLDNYIIVNAANALQNMPEFIFTPLNFLLHIF